MPDNRCRKCRHPLTDPLSVKIGMGPVCRAKAGMRVAKARVIGARRKEKTDYMDGQPCLDFEGREGKMIELILAIVLEAGVPRTLAVEIVKAENAGFVADYVGITGDLGIMQLNPRYIDYFVERYWDKPGEFCWHNPEHNIYVGLRHLKYLLSIPDFNAWQAIMAYNCGEAALRSGNPPNSSIEYANKIYSIWMEGGRDND